jgi:hypothetical protein
MSIRDDHDSVTAARMEAELARFQSDCWYDPARRRIVYRTDEVALRAYLTYQREEMERHKWIESEKASRDLRDHSLSDWVKRHSISFSDYWRRTHVFIPSREAPNSSA